MKFESTAWDGFKGSHWRNDINVRDFIQNNYTLWRFFVDCAQSPRSFILSMFIPITTIMIPANNFRIPKRCKRKNITATFLMFYFVSFLMKSKQKTVTIVYLL